MKRVPLLLLFVIASCARVHTVDVIPMPAEVCLSGKTVSLEGLETETVIDSSLSEEEYFLTVRPRGAKIRGGSERAVFYAFQTLRGEADANGGKVMTGRIHDFPRYSWRGYMLDESRHFFGMDYVKQALDMMAHFKLNKFHWHLTDAPGWRIEIKSHPLLTEVGGVGDNDDSSKPAQFYTQEQIREIIEYAAERYIDVIPEIDMPGHASSATRSYPELAVGEKGSFTFNPGKQEVYSFLGDVLDEVASLFPYEYLHIGGDEVFMGNGAWADDPYISSLMKREGMTKIEEAEGYFLKWASAYVDSLGKKVVAWDDVVDLGVGHCGTALTWWRQECPDHLEKGASDGYELILCPRLPLYLDFVQDTTHRIGRRIWKKEPVRCSIEEIYSFPDSLFVGCPVPEESVRGIQANLWSELVATTERAQFMTYPRICALSESAWTLPARKNYDSFSSRLENAYSLFDSLDIYYYDYRNPSRHAEPLR